ncbi:Esterase/lipase [Mycolicibacterium fortuitum]|jgi:acetyl esterase|uniref:Esterase/lipase n=1 Tax=Mycolicibacterium fortuitum TaxID=1766 RepID=A0A0N9Y5Q9_MYCFO|nr:alpha/beta hydrolase [Mycolicibacterium fortuitum]ALI26499.1 Esterase/lipase [Mycolicibacterium fortuitum]MCA4723569.1 alpha/beta hydrolase [Mycolicibacterium fortuitum]
MTDVNTPEDTMKREVAVRMGDAFAPILEGGMDPVAAAAEVRARLKASRRPARPVQVGHVENRAIPGPAGDIPVRIYHPLDTAESGAGLPVLVYFHGGGFVLCDLDSHDSCCRRLANGIGAVVVSVDYRLAPEHPYPAAVDDAWAATEWAASHAGELGGDPARLVVAGDSAGGNLAAVIAMTARDKGGPAIAFQVLIYPVVDQRRKSSLSSPHTKSGVLTAEHMQWFTAQYLGASGAQAEVSASPILGDMTGLPDAHVLTGALDPLCEEGEEYARMLAAGGARVSVRRYERGFHGFFNLADHLPAAAEATEDVCAVVRDALDNPNRTTETTLEKH